MVTIYGDPGATEVRSGGKMVRKRRIVRAKTPYDRPRLSPPVVTENPNWFASTTQKIASGAGKLFSSVFGSDSSSSSSSSSYSTSSSSDDEFADDMGHEDIFSQETGTLHVDPQLLEGNSETKNAIERLLMQETFSREECDRLINIIRSRVVHIPTVEKDQRGRLSQIPKTLVGSDLCSSAVMEAKKWLEEKKQGPGSKSELDHGTCSLNSVMLPHHTDDEVGSPVDVARSYMRARPPWASPSVNNVEVKTPSPVKIALFEEETPRTIRGSSFSSSKLKRNFLATGSWSISEEIRRVRAKASEDLLGSLPSSNLDLSTFALEHRSGANSLTAGTTELGTRDKLHNCNSLIATKSIVLEMTQDGLQNEAFSSTPPISTPEQNQDLEAMQSVEGKQCDAFKSDQCTIPDVPEQYFDSKSKETTELRCPSTANGFPLSGSSLPTQLDAEPDSRPSVEQLTNPVSSSHEKINAGVPGEENCELLSEASVEIPIINETNSIASGSQNSSSMPYEELTPQNKNSTDSKRSLAGKKNVDKQGGKYNVDKQGGKKPNRYNRKGKARGK